MSIDWEWMIETLQMMCGSLRDGYVNRKRELAPEHKAALPFLGNAMYEMQSARDSMATACKKVDDIRSKQVRKLQEEQGDKEPVF